MGLKDAWNQIVYAFSTEDRYAEYDANAPAPPTNTHARSTSRSGIQLGNASGFGDDEQGSTSEGLSETILAWRIIETWSAEHHVDLNASLADPCTRADVAAAEADLGVQLPAPVRASLRLHDGQEDLDSLTGAGGLFYGMPLMALDEIVQMTKTWRTVAERLELDNKVKQNIAARNALISPTGSSTSLNHSTSSLVEAPPQKLNSSAASPDPELEQRLNGNARQNRFKSSVPVQRSLPPGAVQPVYAHAQWIPLITDLAGNHIGVDLAPGPQGKHGQVIVFGRDFDTKFVLAEHWGDFLVNFAKDLENGNFDIVQDVDDVLGGEGDLVFKDRRTGREIAYMRVLTDRAMMKYRAQQKQDSKPNKQSEPAKPLETVKTVKTESKPLPKERIVPQHDRVVSQDITGKDKENHDDQKTVETVKIVPEDEDDDEDNGEQDLTAVMKDDEETVNGFKEISL